ncbi:unnamed protein product [Diamesa tonsa]
MELLPDLWEFGATLPVTLSCDSCGKECASACGTRHFRSCCFNYLRKRSGPDEIHHPTRLKLELWFAKSQLEKSKRSQKQHKTDDNTIDQQNDQQSQQDNPLSHQYYKPIPATTGHQIVSDNNSNDVAAVVVEDNDNSNNNNIDYQPHSQVDTSRLQFIYDA